MTKQIKVSSVKILKCDKCGKNLIYKEKKMVCNNCSPKVVNHAVV